MIKKNFLKPICYGSYIFSLLLLAACSSSNSVTTPTKASTPIQIAGTAIPTVSNTEFAATGGSSSPVNRDAHRDNLTTIHSAVDRPVAKFLNVPPRAKGVLSVDNPALLWALKA